MEGTIHEENEELVKMESHSQHEPHEHAKPRLFIGIGATLLLLVGGYFVWANWGDDIKEACFGDGEVCSVELPDAPSEGGTDISASFELVE